MFVGLLGIRVRVVGVSCSCSDIEGARLPWLLRSLCPASRVLGMFKFKKNTGEINFVSREECCGEDLPLVDWSGEVEWRKMWVRP